MIVSCLQRKALRVSAVKGVGAQGGGAKIRVAGWAGRVLANFVENSRPISLRKFCKKF